MKPLTSLSSVIGLWLGTSFLLWLIYRSFIGRSETKRLNLLGQAQTLLFEGRALFLNLRQLSNLQREPRATFLSDRTKVRDQVRALLNAIEANSAYFERVRHITKKLAQALKQPDFSPLSEILQVRRDFWAASEVLLIDDLETLKPELQDASAREAFCAQALDLLFGGAALFSATEDPILMRFSWAEAEVERLHHETQAAIRLRQERYRWPTVSEFVAGPWTLIKGLSSSARMSVGVVREVGMSATAIAKLWSLKSGRLAAFELKRARYDLPQRFSHAFDKAGDAALKGGAALKRHYDFLIQAEELKARYADLLAKAPALTERGKEFIERLELETRAEQFLQASEGVLSWTRLKIVLAIAYLIAGLQRVQAKITPAANKQLAVCEPVTSEADATHENVLSTFAEQKPEFSNIVPIGRPLDQTAGQPKTTNVASLMDRLAALDPKIADEQADVSTKTSSRKPKNNKFKVKKSAF